MNFPEKLPFKTYWGSVLMIAFVIFLYHQSNDHRRHVVTQAAMMSPGLITAPRAPLPDGVGRMLGTRAAFFGPQLNAEQLTNFLASYQIDHVIDLAHEAKAEKVLAQDAERFIVENTRATYWPLNIEARGNRLNQTHLATIDSLMDSGEPVFVHCLHGIHRAGVVKGRAYARDRRRWNEIVALLGWEKVVEDDQYLRYVNDVWEQVQQRNHPPK